MKNRFFPLNPLRIDFQKYLTPSPRHESFLDYGNKRNCLKIISLFLFVDHILSLLDKNLDQVAKTEKDPLTRKNIR